MKLQTLNIWGGRIFEPLIHHLQQQSNNIDIFCFQEVYESNELKYTRGDDPQATTSITQANRSQANSFTEIQKILQGFTGMYLPAQDHYDHLGSVKEDLQYGLATFVRKNISLLETAEAFVHGSRNSMRGLDYSTLPRNVHLIKVPVGNQFVNIFNFHGLWNGQGKTDSPQRIAQSHKVREFMNKFSGPKILCGDFNLVPGTESLQILEEGMKNLIITHDVSSTRSSFYTKEVKLADYILVSPEINVIDFKVLKDEVSDHLPLYLEFDLAH